MLLTDGVPNVLGDGPYSGRTNAYNIGPYFCGESQADLNNPIVQYGCPIKAQTGTTPPIQLMVDVANAASAEKNIEFYTVLFGFQNGLTFVDLHLDEVAPNGAFQATTAAELSSLVAGITDQLLHPCEEISATRTAAGASVVIRNSAGTILAQALSDASGSFRATLPYIDPADYSSGNDWYTMQVTHNNVIAPGDWRQIPRDYAYTTQFGYLDGGISSWSRTLTNVNPENAMCPQ